MSPLNKRAKASRSRARDKLGRILPSKTTNVVLPIVDDAVMEEPHATETHDLNSALPNSINNILTNSFKENVRSKTYTDTSRTTIWRIEKEAKTISDRGKLTSFGFLPTTLVNEPVVEEPVLSRSEQEIIEIQNMINKLTVFVQLVRNKKNGEDIVSNYNYTRYISVRLYFLQRLEGSKKIAAATEVAKLL